MTEESLEMQVEEISEKKLNKIAKAITNPRIIKLGEKKEKGASILYSSLQKSLYEDISYEEKEEMGIEDKEMFVPKVTPVQEQKKAQDIADKIFLHSMKQHGKFGKRDAKEYKELLDKVNKGKFDDDEDEKDTIYRLNTVRQRASEYLMSNGKPVSWEGVVESLISEGLTDKLKEGLADGVKSAYIHHKRQKHLHKLKPEHKESVIEKYITKKDNRFDGKLLKSKDHSEIVNLFVGVANADRMYEKEEDKDLFKNHITEQHGHFLKDRYKPKHKSLSEKVEYDKAA